MAINDTNGEYNKCIPTHVLIIMYVCIYVGVVCSDTTNTSILENVCFLLNLHLSMLIV